MAVNSRNWAGNFAYTAARTHEPGSVAELQQIVTRSSSVKALGSRHSFNEIADTSGDLVSTAALGGAITMDAARRRVSIPAGATYGRLCPELDVHGLAVANLASLPHISVAGGCATATHGSGNANPNLAAAVAEVEIVTADGSLVTLNRESPEFNGAVVALGGLGIVIRITLDVVPAFFVAQEVYEDLPFEELESSFDEITSAAYSVSFFTDWKGASVNQVWFKRRVTQDALIRSPDYLFGAKRATMNLHPIRDISPVNCTEQMGVPGPSYERLPHFRMDFTPSAGEELQTEYLVPRVDALDALRTIKAMHSRISGLLQISEVRTVAADDLWMSPCYGQACVGIHFTWEPDWPGVSQVLPEIEAALEPFSARPHWGKLFAMSGERIAELYPRLSDFRRLLEAYDPKGKFRNEFLDRVIFG